MEKLEIRRKYLKYWKVRKYLKYFLENLKLDRMKWIRKFILHEKNNPIKIIRYQIVALQKTYIRRTISLNESQKEMHQMHKFFEEMRPLNMQVSQLRINNWPKVNFSIMESKTTR